ncbi:MAG TPA: TonB-dependent receptor plug domain-containing protein [Salinivirgaceae bacterium]|nr:TonB-dependent receptor plug domain-containing protein [Salinivirgaceae bacterium]
MKTRNLILALFVLLSVNLAGQQISDEELFSMSLEELMNIEVTVATKQSLSIRETPGVVTVIQKDDIANSGARDLLELLRIYVPGVEFAVDVEGVVGIGMRGLWSNEGKVLLLINGMEVNEDMFATLQLGNRYNVDIIEKIEIIRGPGSAVYGGYASMGVINIITKKPEQGGYISAQRSLMTKSFSHVNLASGAGWRKNDFNLNVNAAYNMGSRSQNQITDYSLNSNSMLDSSDIKSYFIDLCSQYKGLKFYGLIDNYELNYIDLWGTNFTNYVIKEKFYTSLANLEYKQKLGENVSVTPWIQYKYQLPWNTNIPEEGYSNNKHIEKYSAGINSEVMVGEYFLTAGVSYYSQQLHMPENPTQYEETFKDSSNTLSVNNFTAFAQGVLKLPWLNVTLGGRYDHSDQFGGSFVPRIGLTKAYEKLHLKLIAAQAFRIPGGILINRQPNGVDMISPEKSTNIEAEIGYKITSRSWLTINAFNSWFNDAITYATDTSGRGFYTNQGTLGTYGFEVDYKISAGNFTANLTYAFYQPQDDSAYTYRIREHNDYFLGFAKHKLTAIAIYRVSQNIWLNANSIFYGPRYSFTHADSAENDVLTKHNSQLIINSNIRFDNFLTQNLELTIGINNLTNEKVIFPAPYRSGHGPLPSHGISFMGRIVYKF